MTALTLQRGFPLRCNGSMSAALERDIDLERIAAHFTKSVPHQTVKKVRNRQNRFKIQ